MLFFIAITDLTSGFFIIISLKRKERKEGGKRERKKEKKKERKKERERETPEHIGATFNLRIREENWTGR